jgi:hypothetical protein
MIESDDPAFEYVLGSELKIGDVMIWWYSKRHRIISTKNYVGPLKYLFPKGVYIAIFDDCPTGMTIDSGDYYKIVKRV